MIGRLPGTVGKNKGVEKIPHLERRHMTPSQRAALAVDILPFYEEAAKERQLSELKQNRGGKNSTTDKGKARDFVARDR